MLSSARYFAPDRQMLKRIPDDSACLMASKDGGAQSDFVQCIKDRADKLPTCTVVYTESYLNGKDQPCECPDDDVCLALEAVMKLNVQEAQNGGGGGSSQQQQTEGLAESAFNMFVDAVKD